MIFSTSNKTKREEFKKYLPDLKIIEGQDIREVEGTLEEVIIHKSVDIGKGFLVEDTILIVNGEEVVDIRWKLDSLREGDIAIWITSLAYNDGENIYVYEGTVNGFITKERGNKGPAFDPHFIPMGSTSTLTELGERKSEFRARIRAIDNLLKWPESARSIVKLKDIKKWTGRYQNEK